MGPFWSPAKPNPVMVIANCSPAMKSSPAAVSPNLSSSGDDPGRGGAAQVCGEVELGGSRLKSVISGEPTLIENIDDYCNCVRSIGTPCLPASISATRQFDG